MSKTVKFQASAAYSTLALAWSAYLAMLKYCGIEEVPGIECKLETAEKVLSREYDSQG